MSLFTKSSFILTTTAVLFFSMPVGAKDPSEARRHTTKEDPTYVQCKESCKPLKKNNEDYENCMIRCTKAEESRVKALQLNK